MAPVTQIMYFKTSLSYLQDPAWLISELATQSSVAKIKGLSKAYLGFETEDLSNAFWVFTDTFKATQSAARQIIASKPTHTFAGFSNTSRIFSAPVTEFVTFTLKRGVSMNVLQPLIKRLQFYGSSWAPVVDKPNVVHGVLGWECAGPLKEIIDEVKKVANLWLVHAILITDAVQSANLMMYEPNFVVAVIGSRKRTAVSSVPVLGSSTKTCRAKAEAADLDVRDGNDDQMICDDSADYLEFVFTCCADPVSHRLHHRKHMHPQGTKNLN
ncbi:uncharacterized protein BJ212DRAFT_1296740 [Suillus subaureus]|uniref:Uncharacterized protein n=1 Tax=Suillus subaureus TaxID=48587 RepID=A0A9P7JHF3_9AGAM|nr:uncharacterized protein BJ212DRAFT_1296740 [Suillus subaureus]KAG1822777.1 hypothetical protein BJ212DRAFT_1296740 [Suillus subaureus]